MNLFPQRFTHTWSTHKVLLFTVSFLLLFSLGSYAVASFTPGQTLDPNCSPGDSGCYVEIATNIGSSIGSGTEGSVLYLGASGVLAQDNANLFFDSSNIRLGVGTSSPAATIHAVDTTEQMRLGYDADNYLSTTISSTGATTFTPTGTQERVYFDSDVSIGNTANDARKLFFDEGWQQWIQGEGESGVFTINNGGGGGWTFKIVQNSETPFFISTGNNIGLGTGAGTVSARLHLIKTTEQMRIGYNASNYYSTTVGSTGRVTFDATGSGAGFAMADSLNLSSTASGARFTIGDFTGTTAGYYGFEFGYSGTYGTRLTFRPFGNSTGFNSAYWSYIGISENGYDFEILKPTSGALKFMRTQASPSEFARFTDTGNFLIGTTTDTSNKLYVDGSSRFDNGTMYFYYPTRGIDIRLTAVNGSAGTDVLVGGHLTTPSTSGNRTIVGFSNRWNTSYTNQHIFGYANRVDEVSNGTFIVVGTANRIINSDYYYEIFGHNNVINYTPATTGRGAFAMGWNNEVLHSSSAVLGVGQVTTASNQLLLAQHQSNCSSCGFNDVYFGNGVRASGAGSQLNNWNGTNVTLNASGAGAAADLNGGHLTLAGGKGTGIGTPGNVYISTASTGSSGTTLQSLSQRFVVEATTGDVGIGDLTPDYRLEVYTATATYVGRFFNDGNSASNSGLLIQAGLDDHTAAGPSTLIGFADGDGTSIGSITFGSSAVAYNTTSDQRLKTNIVDTTLSLDTLRNIQVRDFSFIADTEHKTVHGFIAQELYTVYPTAVTKPLDESSSYWMVDYSKLVPLLVKSVQDLDVRIEAFTSLDETKPNSLAYLVTELLSRGVKNIFADRVQTKQLCIEDVCVTKSQLQDLLNSYNPPATYTPVTEEEPTTEEEEVVAEDPIEETPTEEPVEEVVEEPAEEVVEDPVEEEPAPQEEVVEETPDEE